MDEVNEPTIDERVAAFRMELMLLGVPHERANKEAAVYLDWLNCGLDRYAEAYRQACINKARANNDKRTNT